MAVYTDVSEDELAQFLKGYAIGAPRTLKGIAEGVENSNFLLETQQGRFFLTLYEKRVAEADLPFFLGLLDHLSARGINCPRPIARGDGARYGHLAGRPAAIVTFLEGLSLKRPAAAHCEALGGALAKLHAAGADYALTRANALGPDGWRTLAARIGPRAEQISPGLEALIAAAVGSIAPAWPHSLPVGTIHADLFPDNVFFLGETLSGVIDFYFACTDILAYDVAICLNAWCFEGLGEFNVTKARALLRGYQKVRGLSDAERHALPMLCRGAALRFLLTRALDWIEQVPGALVRPKDPMEYVRKLKFHQSVRSHLDYGLDG